MNEVASITHSNSSYSALAKPHTAESPKLLQLWLMNTNVFEPRAQWKAPHAQGRVPTFAKHTAGSCPSAACVDGDNAAVKGADKPNMARSLADFEFPHG